MKRFLTGALLAVLAAFATPASAHFIDGYLAECTAVATGSCTEATYTGYHRQPMYFNVPPAGVIVNGQYFNFGSASASQTLAGRAIYDAATGGHLLFVVPWAASFVTGSQADNGDVGAFSVTLTGYTTTPGDLISLNLASGATLGTNATSVSGAADGSTVSTGYQLGVARGFVTANSGGGDPFYLRPTEVTGFSATIPAGISTFIVHAAGTLATGTIVLQAAPVDGATQIIGCDHTITALTVTPTSGYTIVGTAPTSCAAGAAHEFRYSVPNTQIFMLY